VRLFAYGKSWAIGLAIFLLILLIPPPARLPHRDVSRDLVGLRQTECEYRGITATFEELTRAYILQTYEEGQLIGWEARPSPRHPAAETLVTARFKVAGAKKGEKQVNPSWEAALRNQAAPHLGVAWRYHTLGAVRITPANDYAADALAVYQRLVDDFIAQMMVALVPTVLRQGPGADFPEVEQIDAGTVLLHQSSPEQAETPADWRYVRIPSTTTFGWVPAEELVAVEHEY
jgi:hypothetical protein